MTEVRLIDANALKKRARHVFKSNTGGRCPPIVNTDDIDATPTIDPESLRPTGRWIWSELYDNNWRTLCCSNCFETEGARENAKYCPNCGAKMDEG